LECNRGSDPICLDWSEICDGFIDCQDGIDEKHCWQLETNECADNEYRCHNGQCIPIAFFSDDTNTFQCLDQTDALHTYVSQPKPHSPLKGEPIFSQEDVVCSRAFLDRPEVQLTSSCVFERSKILLQAMFFNKPRSVSNDC
jgi:hypothetical protein